MKLNDNQLQQLREKVFVSNSEEVKSILGADGVQELIANRRVNSSTLILTNKRVYQRGKALNRKGFSFKSVYQENTVDIKEISGTGFNVVKPTGFKITGIVLVILIILAYFIASQQNFINHYLFLLLPPTTLTWSLYFIGIRNTFELNYSGGTITLNVNWYSEEELRDFSKQLNIARENLSEKLEPSNSKIYNNKDRDIIEKLRNCKELLDGGAITNEEFEKLKSEILS